MLKAAALSGLTGMARAPGRVNLIGEHIDYAGGHVLPVAIDRGVGVAVRRSHGDTFHLLAPDIAEDMLVFLPEAAKPPGAAAFLWVLAEHLDAAPMDVFVHGDLPIGMGLASSAAYCVALAMAMEALNESSSSLTKLELAHLCMEVEREATGVGCGLMDPYAAILGRQGYALLLDCSEETHREVPLDLGDAWLLVVDSAKPRLLAESGYNERRREVAELVEAVRRRVGAFARLWELPVEKLEAVRGDLTPVLQRRLRHLLSEEPRVMSFVEALEATDLKRMGELLVESHLSLRDDYEVSCAELDFLVDELRKLRGVVGARLLGGGFGGSVLALVSQSEAEGIAQEISDHYYQRFALTARCLVVTSGEGAEAGRG
ncbi:MAG: galactokinase [Planctomycetales bacterium 4484_113]|nr:MAG: galactokinase [Planctomycetales bacterium 4484_113]